MNGPQHLNMARRDLSDSYDDEKTLFDRQLAAVQAQAHAMIALTCAVADAYELNQPRTFDAHVADALAAVTPENRTEGPQEAPETDEGPIWRCASTRHSMRCQLADSHATDHEYRDALGTYAWTTDGPPVEIVDQADELPRTCGDHDIITEAQCVLLAGHDYSHEGTHPFDHDAIAWPNEEYEARTAPKAAITLGNPVLRLVPPFLTAADGAQQRGMC